MGKGHKKRMNYSNQATPPKEQREWEPRARAPLNEERAVPEGSVVVQTFYKGTNFPVSFVGPADKWAEVKGMFEESIISGLRRGVSLPDQIRKAQGQLDAMEDCLNNLGKKAGDGLINQSRWTEWMEKEFLSKMAPIFEICPSQGTDPYRVLWMMNVHLLVKTNTIQDDDMNGWQMIGGDIACLLASFS